jgi:hypothetical protein
MPDAPSPPARDEGLDAARGALLLVMVLVHVVSAHASGEAVTAMRDGFAVILISAGFVTLSGWVAAMKDGPATRTDASRAIASAVQLLLVMGAAAVAFSLLRHALAGLAGGAASCRADAGWTPPDRLDDLGILLPIALVQLQSPLARAGAPGRGLLLALAALWSALPVLTAAVPDQGAAGAIVGVLARRTLTPFYTVSSFVAFGLAGAFLARTRVRDWAARTSPRGGAASLAAALGLAFPPVAAAVELAAYRPAQALGAVASAGYWVLGSVLFLRGVAGLSRRGGGLARGLALLGRRSLLVFVLHGLLLEVDAFARNVSSSGKGLGLALLLAGANAALLLAAARAVERFPGLRRLAAALLLERAAPAPGTRPRAFGRSGAAALAIVALAHGAAGGRGQGPLVVDRFEDAACPSWWTFGSLRLERLRDPADPERGAFLSARGRTAPFASGTGLYLDRDLDGRRTLSLDVRGEGPGSGRLRIELCEDDDGNWDCEKDGDHVPVRDDRFVHEIEVDWSGWRTLEVPPEALRDDNPGGNGVFDPQRDLTSGGLLEIQLLFAPAEASDRVRIDVDEVRWNP